MYMVMLVLDVADRLDAVLEAWNGTGIRGATIAETAGAYRRTKRRHVVAPYAVGGVTPTGLEHGNYTLWAIVPDEETVRRWIRAGELKATLLGSARGGYRIRRGFSRFAKFLFKEFIKISAA